MIFDDHDIRDDWNTSDVWRRRDEREPVVAPAASSAALASYWVYQHLGNLSPSERGPTATWQAVQQACRDGEGGSDVGEALDAFADRADDDPESYRWSYSRELGGTRLVVLDSRAGRVLGAGAPVDAGRGRDGLGRGR